MKVKKFVAPTMPEVMMKIRKDLGPDAVILSSKEVQQDGLIGFFKKKNIEVIAALDPKPEGRQKKEKPVIHQSNNRSVSKEKPDINEQVLREINQLRTWIERNGESKPKFPLEYTQLYDILINQEVKQELAEEVINSIIGANEQKINASVSIGREELINEVAKRLNTISLDGIDYRKKVVHLVGPTGVGKTTTIAKIAANCVLKDKKKVAFITMDTYRIAAIDQLKTYSKILDVPLEVAYTIEDYQQARKKFENYDLVLVDTAGRNFRDWKYVKELGQLIDLQADLKTFLVLSLTTRSSDLETIVNQFKSIPIDQLIFTKTDETETYGAILNLCMEKKLGVAYLTDGQNVPDDIKEVTPQLLSRMIVGEKSNE
ncbi:flagellar biosynthesis protein FlhF [Aquibacillus salsiterrae]|uniref:Flagellar biosynthesis protein FlhF n=1 Tax=Aquibacillus salsiterrae TaxID=2950439 RepID=A0A9X4AE50_9BACI|nr:flagellar biosynthesis protein FlhF [Aquibacillus salsiterrae]MDC3416377.1 flagellar biosynthesis protein FlhF [Aquibacillus salsiterrae]